MGDVWVYWDDVSPDGFSAMDRLFAAARKIAGTLRVSLCCVSMDRSAQEQKECLTSLGVDALLIAETEGGEFVRARVLAEMAKSYSPETILFPAQVSSSAIAAQTAMLLGTGLTADCTRLSLDGENRLVQTRPALGGETIADIICPYRRPQMATVRLHALEAATKNIEPRPPCAVLSYRPIYSGTDPLRSVQLDSTKQRRNIGEAKLIVAGGKGIGSRDGFRLLERVARHIGAALGATRAAVDAGFAGWNCQIGQTGTMVAPDLYIGFAISGSVQHIAGMHMAKRVIVVNNDPNAPFFDYADRAILADWREVAELILQTDFNRSFENNGGVT